MSSVVGVLGCGWLGLPLARALIKEGLVVHGSTTSSEKLELLKNEGIVPTRIVLGETEIEGAIDAFLAPLNILILNVPPKLRRANTENYVQKIKLLLSHIKDSNIRQIVFISSTSVYGDVQGEVTEDTPPKPTSRSGIQLLQTEQLLKNEDSLETTIIRFGGLIGPQRHPITFLSGRTELKNGEYHINLIHLNDCIGMVLFILENNYWNETFNGVYPDHPLKADYYIKEAQKRGLPPPKYVANKSENRGKQIKSRNILNKKYCFSTPLTD
ncbi:MAG: SDR family oxidoreductase [Flavobacteriaceae bacterium]